ncbi:MAG: UDP-N-acetylglucosamine 1-carboxyvinyltransferase [Deltaproteobacteria bacterium]|nr:UDP-N-acetylglucosamine 1-carboxyvinyltransferase [Deltaproteobacteria bacterium]
MSEIIEIRGGRPLKGTIQASGAKNAALPMLMATLLTPEPCILRNVPNLLDTGLTLGLLEHFGANCSYSNSIAKICVPKLRATEASYSLVKALRASFWVLGPLLARGGAARVALPGGDAIGTRPVDIHLKALEKMGAEVKLKHGVVYATAPHGLHPAEIKFHFPSVGATHQLMMAAALTPGITTLSNVAREPEVSALADMLNQMGAKIEGAGTDRIVIEGCSELTGVDVTMIGDRIEAGTYLMAAIATAGEITITGINPEHLRAVLDLLVHMGVEVKTTTDSISVKTVSVPNAQKVTTQPFPGFPTDLQAPLMALLTIANGESKIEEKIFEGRYGHVPELNRMGAKITVNDREAIIEGVMKLSAAPVDGGDIRAAAALVVAGLAADGITQIHEIEHLRRGYENLEQKFRSLGAQIGCVPEEIEDAVATGC